LHDDQHANGGLPAGTVRILFRVTETWLELRVSNDALNDGEELRRRLDDDGYLFFKKLQNRDKLLGLRRDMTRVLHAGGWLAADADPMLGIADVTHRCTEGDLDYNTVYFQVQRLESFHGIPHEPELMGVVERIMGGKPSRAGRPSATVLSSWAPWPCCRDPTR